MDALMTALIRPRSLAVIGASPNRQTLGNVALDNLKNYKYAGKVVAVHAEAGDTQKKGGAILTLEAMKMEHTLRAPADGVVRKLRCRVGDFVQEGSELAEFEAAEE